MKILHRLSDSSYVRDIAKLVAGTIVGRGVWIISLPVLTRIYSPADFAELAFYLSVVTTVGVVAAFRLEVAIPIADSDRRAADLVLLALIAVAVVSCLVLITIQSDIAHDIVPGTVAKHPWLVSLGVFLVGCYSVSQHWALRMGAFGLIARAKMRQSVVGASVAVVLGLLAIKPLGLLLGSACNVGAGGLYMLLRTFGPLRRNSEGMTWKRLVATASVHRQYPAVYSLEALFNVAGAQAPVALIAASSSADGGHLLIAMQVILLPLSLVGASVGEVYFSRARSAQASGELAALSQNTITNIALSLSVPLPIMCAAGPVAFPFLFGNEWGRAGEIVFMAAPWIFLQMLASPVSAVFLVRRRQNELLGIQFLGVALRVGSTGAALLLCPAFAIEAFVASSAVFYWIFFRAVVHCAGLSVALGAGARRRFAAAFAVSVLIALCIGALWFPWSAVNSFRG